MSNNPIFTEAFKQMVDGKSVMPLGKDKRPLINTWKEYQSVAATEEQAVAWWDKYPNANLGIVTGLVSGITVIDIDAYKEGSISPDIFPETYTVSTGNGGVHLYYQYVGGLSISADAYPQYPHLDIRSDGGFVVAPPSVTSYYKDEKRVGGEYKVIKNIPLAPFPIEMFTMKKPKKSLNDTVGAGSGKRNDSIASVIGQLLLTAHESKWQTHVLPAVEKINATYKPPLPLDELRTTFNSIANIERNRRNLQTEDVTNE